jgi:hypothetical protein
MDDRLGSRLRGTTATTFNSGMASSFPPSALTAGARLSPHSVLVIRRD